MPNSILKDSICTSENIDALSLEAETFFYRLMVQCDDYGRMDARPAVLRARCFPLRLDRVTEKLITKYVNELVAAGLINVYTVEGHPYLHLVKWEKHQQIRAKRSKYPDPDAADSQSAPVIANASNGNQVIANVPVIQSNPIQSNSGARAPEADPVIELAEVFEKTAGIKRPTPTSEKGQRQVGVLWWHPLRQMVKLANGNAPELVRRSVRQMRQDRLTLSNPNSILKVFISLHGESVTAGSSSESRTPLL
jgi:hypothetical protein